MKGYNQTDASNATAPVANNNTVYLVKTTDANGNAVFTSYTGFKNVATVKIKGTSTADATATVAYATKDSAVSFIYIDATSAKIGDTKVGSIMFVTSTNYTTNGVGDAVYYTLNAIVDGKDAVEVKTKDVTVFSGLTAGKLYELTTNDNGYVTAATEQTTTGTSYTKATVASGATANTGVFGGLTYDGTETVIVIEDGALTTGDINSAEVGDTYYYRVVNASGTAAEQIAIKTIYIVK